MSSVASRIRQNSPSHFVPVGDLTGLIYAYNPTPGAVAQFSTAQWAAAGGYAGNAFGSKYLSSVNGAGRGILKDLGKTVVSSGRTFRKIQLVVRQTATTSTFGVEGQGADTTPNTDFLTGYIELGFEGQGSPAPVAQFGV